ncbi:hypothetical protein E2N92_13050 [Methanofollis formosanus]|uniref:Uncharacterized protein n=1 Tax=Methanofollis formosanus TaxID=299308 RepID=A0A8G1A4J4_9EURY|nr:hypothetical protein [Methanofollis formosanus]QYZ80289.1 hypothetical protein E2N92_13050 [Methanofollis formosanus]
MHAEIVIRPAAVTVLVAPREEVALAVRETNPSPLYFCGRTHPVLDVIGGMFAGDVDVWPVRDAREIILLLGEVKRQSIVVEHDPAFYAPCPECAAALGRTLRERVQRSRTTVVYLATRRDGWLDEVEEAAWS